MSEASLSNRIIFTTFQGEKNPKQRQIQSCWSVCGGCRRTVLYKAFIPDKLIISDADFVSMLPLSFREDEDASQCAVPISTSVIKQIMSKARNEENLEDILADFYGPKSPTGPPWPYVSKDAHR